MKGLELKYFVLKPKGNDEDAEASRYAIKAYAKKIKKHNPELAKEMIDWANREALHSGKTEE